MISIRPSTSPDGATPQEVVASNEEHKKRIPMVWIPATLSVGLLIAAVYLGGRIVTGHPHVKPVAAEVQPVPMQIAPLQPVAEQAPVVPASVQTTAPIETTSTETPAAPIETLSAAPPEELTRIPVAGFVGPLLPVIPASLEDVPMINPQPGERYIQVGALNLQATRRFIQHLRSEKLEPHVAFGPTPELMRVLIGPFPDLDSMNARKSQLESEGIDTFVRQY
jgi:cell division septation protein DedD